MRVAHLPRTAISFAIDSILKLFNPCSYHCYSAAPQPFRKTPIITYLLVSIGSRPKTQQAALHCSRELWYRFLHRTSILARQNTIDWARGYSLRLCPITVVGIFLMGVVPGIWKTGSFEINSMLCGITLHNLLFNWGVKRPCNTQNIQREHWRAI